MNTTSSSQKFLYFAGIDILHSISPPLHTYVAGNLGKNWTCQYLESPLEDVMQIFHRESFAGGIITMPFKQSIMSYLDHVDDIAAKLGACNHVYIGPNGKLHGTNTDFKGIAGALLDAGETRDSFEEATPAGLVIGAGGASRAAVYALCAELGCQTIYVINRDDDEVMELMRDTKQYCDRLIHIKAVAETDALTTPYYIVGAVPDISPAGEKEKEMRAILTTFLSRKQKGILLDMCYKPRRTQHLKLGESHGWRTVGGIQVVLNLVYEQWRTWTGENIEALVPKEDIRKFIEQTSSDEK